MLHGFLKCLIAFENGDIDFFLGGGAGSFTNRLCFQVTEWGIGLYSR